MENKLDQAHPVFRWILERVLSDFESLGWQPRIVYIKRSREEQAQKVKEGSSKTMKSWHVPATIGLMGAGQHDLQVVQGNAADIIDKRYGWNGLAANKDFQFWKDLGRIAKKYGCTWGGDWKMRDVAHIQMNFIEERSRHTFDV